MNDFTLFPNNSGSFDNFSSISSIQTSQLSTPPSFQSLMNDFTSFPNNSGSFDDFSSIQTSQLSSSSSCQSLMNDFTSPSHNSKLFDDLVICDSPMQISPSLEIMSALPFFKESLKEIQIQHSPQQKHTEIESDDTFEFEKFCTELEIRNNFIIL